MIDTHICGLLEVYMVRNRKLSKLEVGECDLVALKIGAEGNKYLFSGIKHFSMQISAL